MTDNGDNTGSAWIAITVKTPPTSGALNVTVAPDKAWYNLGDAVWIYITVTVDGPEGEGPVPVEGAAVRAELRTASGNRYVSNATTPANGELVFGTRRLKKRDGIGTYEFRATASKSGYDPGEGSTTFEVYK